MSKNALVLLIVVLSIVTLSACSNKSELTVPTIVGDINASDYHNWQKYEQEVIENTKLNSSELAEIEDIITPLKDGTASDEEINSIKEEYGNIENYEEYLTDVAKYNKVRDISQGNIEVTEEDRKVFIEKYSDTFAGMNALVFQFENLEKAEKFVNANNQASNNDILRYIAKEAGAESVDWKDIDSLSDKNGISILHNADSNKYNYCEGEILGGVFDTLTDGQMSQIFEYGGKSTVLIRVSKGIVESDDELIDNYMLKIKKEEAYKKYIIDNK